METKSIERRDFTDTVLFVNCVCDLVTEAAQKAILEKGIFHIVFSGGETQKEIQRSLANRQADWDKWEIWIADERDLSLGNNQLNWWNLYNDLLKHVPVRSDRIHPIRVEKGMALAADLYARELQSIENFDLSLLGLGEDGHTASLFPGPVPAIDLPDAFDIDNSPKPTKTRVTLSAGRLCRSEDIIFIVSGENKAKAVEQLMEHKNIPASYIKGQNSTKLFYFCAPVN